MSANNCSAKLTPSTSSSRRRYFTTAGMNQVKSNFAMSPAMEAREVKRISSPDHWACRASRLRDSGRPTVGDWIRARPSSMRARRKKLMSPVAPLHGSPCCALLARDAPIPIAGKGVFASRAGSTRTRLATSPSFLAANSRPCASSARPSCANSCAIWSGSAATPCSRAIITRQAMPLSCSVARLGGSGGAPSARAGPEASGASSVGSDMLFSSQGFLSSVPGCRDHRSQGDLLLGRE